MYDQFNALGATEEDVTLVVNASMIPSMPRSWKLSCVVTLEYSCILSMVTGWALSLESSLKIVLTKIIVRSESKGGWTYCTPGGFMIR